MAIVLVALSAMGLFYWATNSVFAQNGANKGMLTTEKLDLQQVSTRATQAALQQPKAYVEARYTIFQSSGQGGTGKDKRLAPDVQPLISADNTISATTRPVTTSNDAAVEAATSRSGKPHRTESTTYAVQEGDTISSIATQFGITTETVLWANGLGTRSIIRPGQELTILPVSGVQHVVDRGDFLGAIAQQYQGDLDEIIAFNNLDEDGFIREGQVIIIPDGIKRVYATASSGAAGKGVTYITTVTDGYFARPSNGRRSQGLHSYNAADIAAQCGSEIVAAAPGKVVLADGVGWNGGYGKYMKISHPNGTFTLYAHASQLLVSVGEDVARGQVIAYMGSTGRSTGCHVHFEVHGAENPFLK